MLGVEDKDYGEAVWAIIVPGEEAKKKSEKESRPVLTLEELCSWAESKLAPYKVKQTILFFSMHHTVIYDASILSLSLSLCQWQSVI